MTTDTQRLQVLILNMTIIIITILNMIIDTLQLGLEFTIINVSTPIATTITTNVVPNLHQQSPIIKVWEQVWWFTITATNPFS